MFISSMAHDRETTPINESWTYRPITLPILASQFYMFGYALTYVVNCVAFLHNFIDEFPRWYHTRNKQTTTTTIWLRRATFLRSFASNIGIKTPQAWLSEMAHEKEIRPISERWVNKPITLPIHASHVACGASIQCAGQNRGRRSLKAEWVC